MLKRWTEQLYPDKLKLHDFVRIISAIQLKIKASVSKCSTNTNQSRSLMAYICSKFPNLKMRSVIRSVVHSILSRIQVKACLNFKLEISWSFFSIVHIWVVHFLTFRKFFNYALPFLSFIQSLWEKRKCQPLAELFSYFSDELFICHIDVEFNLNEPLFFLKNKLKWKI